jgi:hypothetical protein
MSCDNLVSRFESNFNPLSPDIKWLLIVCFGNTSVRISLYVHIHRAISTSARAGSNRFTSRCFLPSPQTLICAQCRKRAPIMNGHSNSTAPSAAAALRQSFGDRKLPDISRKITACVACRRLKVAANYKKFTLKLTGSDRSNVT